MKSDILVSLIKEVVKTEVKRQVKEEVIKLIKSGDIKLANDSKKTTPSLKEAMSVNFDNAKTSKQNFTKINNKPIKQITKDPLLNEILSQTQPFTASERAEGGSSMGGSILDALQPAVSMEDDWETMDYRSMNMPEMQIQTHTTDNPAVDSLTKALTRDYRELVKRF